ncbi:hypothetical protein HWV62_39623 [Athelia sp. TMB]|nr:hypothetical protein HWV62_39623 [Athelia sp. TMB]
MNIYLTNHTNVQSTTFTNESGQALYKAETPGSILKRHRKTIISKVVPNESLDDMTDRYAELATIEWHSITPSLLTYDGVTRSMKEFMPYRGVLAEDRGFTAPGDGRTFRWKIGLSACTLILDDGSKTLAAEGHRNHIGFLSKPRQARLTIFPGFEHLVDVILITYVYVEKLRQEREQSAAAAAS